MYEISRSKVLSPIVLLFDQFQKIAPEFMYKLGVFLLESDDVQIKDTKNINNMQNNNLRINDIDINTKQTKNNKNSHIYKKNNKKAKTTLKYL